MFCILFSSLDFLLPLILILLLLSFSLSYVKGKKKKKNAALSIDLLSEYAGCAKVCSLPPKGPYCKTKGPKRRDKMKLSLFNFVLRYLAVLPCLVLPYLALSCLVLCYHVVALSCLIVSCRVVSCRYVRVMSYLVVSCQVLSWSNLLFVLYCLCLTHVE